jgi:ribosome-associated translation inhibitor RaiA
MRPTAVPRQMQMIFDVHQYRLSEADRARLEDSVDGLARMVEQFPVADLHIMIEWNARSNDLSVKLSLVLSGSTLVTTDRDAILTVAFDRSLTALCDLVEGYKAKLDGQGERNKLEKGTAHDLRPTQEIDLSAVELAVAAGDYAAFRVALLPFEDSIQARAGRWVQRYPSFESRIGKEVKMSDVTEQIFLTAFDQYEQRPDGLHLSDWMGNLIDPAVKSLMIRTAEEMENINLTRSAMVATLPMGHA